jgi:hypothetical protein
LQKQIPMISVHSQIFYEWRCCKGDASFRSGFSDLKDGE